MSTKKNSSVRFTLNFASKTIVGTKASFDKAGKGFGPVYDELMKLVKQHPDFGFEVKAPKKPAKPKQTYDGMNIPFMLDYASAVNESAFRTAMESVRDYHKNGGEIEFSVYPVIKRMFLRHYAPKANERFAYEKAKKMVRDYRYNGIVTKVTSHTEPVAQNDSIDTLPKAVNL